MMKLVNNNIKKMFVLLAFFFALVAFLPLKNCYAIDRNNWMSEIMDDAKISWLTIPGTHDTATFNVKCSTWGSIVEPGATCQSWNIEQQLAAGIRAFDLRYKWENSKFYLYHGEDSYACKCRDSDGTHLDLTAVLQKCKTFLNSHPNEFILVNIQKESGDYNTTELNKIKSAYGLVSRDNSTTVGQVRGKIVNSSDFMQGISGSSAYNRWEGSVDQKVEDMKTVFNDAPSIYKYYSSTIYQKCICTNLSWRKDKPFTWPEDYAEDVHKKFFGSNPFSAYGQKAYGVILYDFPSNTIVDWTISANDWAKPINCTFKFDSCGGTSVPNQTVKECKYVTKPSDPLRNAYTFVGWYKNSSYTTSWNFAYDKAKDSSTTLYAKWSPVSYNISYSGLDGATNPNKLKTTYTIETATYELKDAVRKGWKFLGWFNSQGTQVKTIETGTYGDISLTARFSIETYDVKFNNIDGATNPNEVATYDVNSDTIELQEATKEHYIFDGWYTQDGTDDDNWGKKVTQIAGGDTGDVVLYAKWTPESYSISYENATVAENPNRTAKYCVETPTIKIADATREGWTFLGWYDEGGNKVTEIKEGSFGDVVLTARWSIDVHKITYDNVEGADNLNTKTTFTIDDDTIVLQPATKNGYVFDGWCTPEGFVVEQIESGTNADVQLVASWTPITYSISYENVGDAENQNTQLSYTIETPTITFKGCTRDEYVFEGWYEKNGTETGEWGNRIKEIKKGSTGNVTLYAKWTQTVSMKRLYNPYTGEHFYTSDVVEFDNLVALSWKDEGEGWLAPATSSTPVYRLYNPFTGDHHYTSVVKERDSLKKQGWKDEGIGWYSDDKEGVALYRQYNPNAKVGSHNYTTSKNENDKLVKAGWKAEGIAWYGLN